MKLQREPVRPTVMLFLFRHWLLPGRLRPLPPRTQLLLLLPALIGILLIVYPPELSDAGGGSFQNEAMRFAAELTVSLVPAVTSVFAMLGGAMSIAVERQKQRLEPLLLANVKPVSIVHAKLLVRLVQGLLFCLPPFIGLIHVWFHMRRQYVLDYRLPVDAPWRPEFWSVTELILKLVTFTLLGMAVSSACRRVHTALSVCGSIIAAYAAIYVATWRLYWCLPFPDDDYLHAHLFYWPVMPPYYYANFRWQHRLTADLILGAALPAICYLFIRLLCRGPHSVVRRPLSSAE